MSRRLRTLTLLALLGMPGCASHPVATTPVPPPPVEVSGTVPAARATGVLYDTPIAVDFGVDMDAASFTASSVLLKLDTQRVPILLSWDDSQRRLHIYPQAALQLRRTYTVQLTGAVATAEGAALGADGWFYQFTTNSVRRPLHPQPALGTANESPFVMMAWDSTEVGVGGISYSLWGGTDSAAVALRSGPPIGTTAKARWLPNASWPIDHRIYWAVTVTNLTTGEVLDGPVQTFSTLPAGLAEDSLLVMASDYGYSYINYGVNPIYPYQYCSRDSVVAVSGTQGWFSFPLTGLPSDVRIASARIELYATNYYVPRLATTTMTAWSSKHAWPLPCWPGVRFPDQLPAEDQVMAIGHQESNSRVIFMSDLLAAHIEAAAHFGGFYGYSFTSAPRVSFVTPHSGQVTQYPYLKIHYFRTLPRPQLLASP